MFRSSEGCIRLLHLLFKRERSILSGHGNRNGGPPRGVSISFAHRCNRHCDGFEGSFCCCLQRRVAFRTALPGVSFCFQTDICKRNFAGFGRWRHFSPRGLRPEGICSLNA